MNQRFVFLCVAAAAAVFSANLCAQTRTSIRDTLYNADGSRTAGQIEITWNGFRSADGKTIAAGKITRRITDGVLDLALVPNAGTTPAGTSYAVTYLLASGLSYAETWVVPQSDTPVSLAAVGASVAPAPSVQVGQQQLSEGGGLQVLLDFYRAASATAARAGQCYWNTTANALHCSTGTGAWQSYAPGAVTFHAGTHASNATDPIGINASQITSGTLADSLLPAAITGDKTFNGSINIRPRAGATDFGPESYAQPTFTPSHTKWRGGGDFRFVGDVPTYLTAVNKEGYLVQELADMAVAMEVNALYHFEWTLQNVTAGDLACEIWGDPLLGTIAVADGTSHLDFTFPGGYPPYMSCTGTTGGFEVVRVSLKEILTGNESYAQPTFTPSHTKWRGGGDFRFVGDVPTYTTAVNKEGYLVQELADMAVAMEVNALYHFEWTLQNVTAGDLACEIWGDPLLGTIAVADGTSHLDFTFPGGYPPYMSCTGTTGAFEVVRVSLKEMLSGNVRVDKNLYVARNLNASVINGVLYADQFPGADAGAKIAACIAALPDTGGTCDARGFKGAQAISATITLNKSGLTLLLPPPGAATFTNTANPALAVSTASNVLIDSGRIVLSGANASCVHYIGVVSNLTVQNQVCEGDGLVASAHSGFSNPSGQTLTNIKLLNNTVSSVTLGMSLNAALGGSVTGGLIQGNHITNVVGTAAGTGYGIHHSNLASANPANVRIVGNYIEGAQRHSIYQGGGNGVVISQNTIRNHRIGTGVPGSPLPAIEVSRTNAVVVSDNLIYAPKDGAISFGPDEVTPADTSGCDMDHNVIYLPTGVFGGIVIGSTNPTIQHTVSDVNLRGNVIYTNGWDGNLISIYSGIRVNLGDNLLTIINAPTVGAAVSIQASDEVAGTATYTDQLTFRSNTIYGTTGAADMRGFDIGNPAATSSVRMDFISNRITADYSFYYHVVPTNPNIHVFDTPADGLNTALLAPLQVFPLIVTSTEAVDLSVLGGEALKNGTDFAGGNWHQTGDFAIGGGTATYTDNTHSGDVVQYAADQNTPAVGSRWYKFVYDVTTNTLTGTPVVTITTSYALTAQTLNLTVGNAKVRNFRSAVAPTDFIVNITGATGGVLVFDNFSLKEVVGGGGIFNGFINWSGQKRVTVQFDKTNDTTLTDIPGLSVVVQSGKTYSFEAILYTTSNVAAGVKAAIAGTCTATAIIYEGLTVNAGLTTQGRAVALSTAVGGVTAVTAAQMKINGTIRVNAGGTLTVQFAQNVAGGSASSVLVGSTFTVENIP